MDMTSSPSSSPRSRRAFVSSLALFATVGCLLSCSKKSEEPASASPAASGAASAAAPAAAKPFTVGFIYVGSKTDYGLQSSARRRRKILGRLGREDPRRRERGRDARRAEDHGEHDQSGRRDGAVSDFLRLLRSPHPEDGGEIPAGHVPALRRSVRREQAPEERGQLLRLHRRGGVRRRRRGGAHDQEQQARLRGGQAHSASPAQHQFLHARRPLGEPEGHLDRDFSRANGRCP